MQAGDARLLQAKQWLQHVVDEDFEVRDLAGDASFRRYFRVHTVKNTWVLMDAPPDKEDCLPFLHVRTWLQEAGLHVPDLIAFDEQQGLLLLEDFGDDTWAVYVKNGGDIQPLFKDALLQLHTLQAACLDHIELPIFNIARMQRECDLYLDWYLPHVAGYVPTDSERTAFHHGLLPCLQRLQALPQRAVHLDYHCRNLMLPKVGLPLGVIDFQDAVLGPVTYDLASLLYDCYQDYPEALRRQWSEHFFENLDKQTEQYFDHFDDWHGCLRLTALQRHIKAIGIFSRLAYRDGKQSFLHEIPLTRKHLQEEMILFDLPKSVLRLLQQG